MFYGKKLEEVERQISARNLVYLGQNQPDSVIDLNYLKLLHKLVFEDIYSCDGLCAPKMKELNRLISSNSARLL